MSWLSYAWRFSCFIYDHFTRSAFDFNRSDQFVPAPSHEPKPLATSPPGTFLAKLQNFKKFVGFWGVLDIIW